MDTIGSRIKQLRKETKHTQMSFGEKLGVSHAHISNIESGKDCPSDTLVKLIAIKFNVTEEWLKQGGANKYNTDKGFVRENIDLIKGNMSYEALSNDIAVKLGNPEYETLLSYGYLEKIREDKITPTFQDIHLLSMYAQVDKEFFYRHNTSEDLFASKQEYKTSKESRIFTVDEEMDEFMRNPANLKYIRFAKKLRDRSIDPDKIISYTLSAD